MIGMNVPGGGTKYWLYLKGSAQTITSGSSQKYTGFAVSAKSDSWGTVSSTSDIVIPVTGLWLITCFDADWQDGGSGAGRRTLAMRIDDAAASVRAGVNGPPTLAADSTPTAQSFPRMRPMSAGATIQIYLRQQSGSDKSVSVQDLGLYLLDTMTSNPLVPADG